MNIVLTGSLGNISKPLAIELIAKGHSVTVLSSKDHKRKEIEEMGAIASIGSLEDTAFLVSVFKDADAAYCMIPPNFAELDQLAYYKRIGNNYAQAIQQSGIRRIVHLSSWGAHLDKGTGIILGSHYVEIILNKLSNIAVTHLRSASIFYNLYNLSATIKNFGFICTNYGGTDKIVWVHPTDIATAAAEELCRSSATGSNIRYVASDEKTADETAEIIGKAIGKPDLKWLVITDDQEREALIKYGLPASIADNIVDLHASIHSGALGEDYELNKPEMGKVKTEDFAIEFAKSFNH